MRTLLPPSPSASELLRPAFRAADVTYLDVRLPACASELKEARERVTAASVAFGLDARGTYEFVFAVNEALTNAIKHGSPDGDGTVGLAVAAEGDALVCTVCDCGPFTPPADPDSEESGRGFPFMEALTDGFELLVEPDATVVRLRKHRPADTDAFGV